MQWEYAWHARHLSFGLQASAWLRTDLNLQGGPMAQFCTGVPPRLKMKCIERKHTTVCPSTVTKHLYVCMVKHLVLL